MPVVYLDHFGLRQAPFGITPDLALFYSSQSHKLALDRIEDGVAARLPMLSLTGDVGMGKTTLLRFLRYRHRKDWIIGVIWSFPSGDDGIFVQARRALGLPDRRNDSPAVSSRRIRRFAEAMRPKDRLTLLIVDEAQTLGIEGISALASLTRNGAEGSALSVLLVGQPELRELLAAPELRDLRIGESASVALTPFSEGETADYVAHRLAQAGAPAPIFDAGAMQVLHDLGQGVPGSITLMADYCLMIAAAEGVSSLDGPWVSTVLYEARATVALSQLAELEAEGPPPSATHAVPPTLTMPDPGPTPAADDAPAPEGPRGEPQAPQGAPNGRERGDRPLLTADALRAGHRPDAAPVVLAAPVHVPLPGGAPMPRSPPHGRRLRPGLMLSAAAMVLASGAAFVWLQPRQAHAPGAIVPPRVAVEQVAPAPAQPARPPPAPQPAALVPEPVAVTPDPAVTALMQRAFDMEEHDPAGAAVAYARAALRGSPRAAYYLGQFHETGAGVEPSSGLAGLWYAAAGDLPAAQQRLQALSGAVAQTGTPSAPLPIFQARLRSGGSEMIWSLRDGVTPVRFRVESFGPADKPLPVTETAVPGLILPFPVSAWRVIAIGADDTESAPSATVRMIPAGE